MSNIKAREQEFLRLLKSEIEAILEEENSPKFSQRVNNLSGKIKSYSDHFVTKSVKKLGNMDQVLKKSKDDYLFQKAYLSWVKKICEASRITEEEWEKIYEVFVKISDHPTGVLFGQIGNLNLAQIQDSFTVLKNQAKLYQDLPQQYKFILDYKNSMNTFVMKVKLLEKNEAKILKVLEVENSSYQQTMAKYLSSSEYTEKIQAAFREYKSNLFNKLLELTVEKITENYQNKLKEIQQQELQLAAVEETSEDNSNKQGKEARRRLLPEFDKCTDLRAPDLSEQDKEDFDEISPAALKLTPVKMPKSALKTANTPSSPAKKVHFARNLVQTRSFSTESDSDSDTNSPATSLQTSRSAIQSSAKVGASNLPVEPSTTESSPDKKEVTIEESMQQKYTQPRLNLLKDIKNKKNKYKESKALLLEFLTTETVKPEIHKKTMALINAVDQMDVKLHLHSVASKILLVNLSLLVNPEDKNVRKTHQQFTKELAQLIPDNFVAKLVCGAMLALGAAVLAVGVLMCAATLGGGATLGSITAATGASLMLLGGLGFFSESGKSDRRREINEVCTEMNSIASSMPKL